MEEQGLSRELRDLGAMLLPPGCGPCPGKHLGIIAPQDRVLAATVRNSPGRMGSAEAEIYLASPRTAGASAAAGVIADLPQQPAGPSKKKDRVPPASPVEEHFEST
jgi:3-isopropylmalate/(R)-2-methylmalate dehydratase large subunit